MALLNRLRMRGTVKRTLGPPKAKRVLPIGVYGLGMAITLLGAGISLGQSNGGSSASDQRQGPSQEPAAGEKKQNEQSPARTTKLKVIVTGNTGKAIGNATVYVRFPESGGFLRHQKLAELDLKTNQDGTVKVPEIPRGKVLIQVIAKGWHTYGKWYEINTEEQTIEIALEPPPHWY